MGNDIDSIPGLPWSWQEWQDLTVKELLRAVQDGLLEVPLLRKVGMVCLLYMLLSCRQITWKQQWSRR